MNKKTTIITGASGDIGGACARFFAQRQYRTILPVRNMGKPESQALMLLPDSLVIPADVEQIGDAMRLFQIIKNDNIVPERLFLTTGLFLWDDGFPLRNKEEPMTAQEAADFLEVANVKTKENTIAALRSLYQGDLKNMVIEVVGSHAAGFGPDHEFRNGPYRQEGYVHAMQKVCAFAESLRASGDFKEVVLHEPPLIDTSMARAAFTPERAPDIDWSKAIKPDDYILSIYENTELL